MFESKTLAVNGGTPVRTKPWLDNFTTGEEEKRAALEVLESGYLSLFEGSHTPDQPFSFWGGPRVQRLEAEWADYYGARFAVSMNSATSCLYATVGALGIGYGDEVIVSPYTMSACAVCPLLYGAIPIFADVQLETGCLDPASIESHITARTRAIVVVHQFGIPADMDPIMALARRQGLKVIEDCAQAHGARYRGRPVGTIGDVGVFSLNVNKTIQAGEGGVCLTNDEDLRYRLALIRNHGEAVVGPAGYENITNIVGFNYRLTEMSAAVAREQLKKLAGYNALRRGYVETLSAALARHACLVPPPRCAHAPFGAGGCAACASSYYVYPLRLLPEALGAARAQFARAVNAEGVRFFEGYVRPLYLQPIYQTKRAFKHGYPFSAPENRAIETNYHAGACPNVETLHFEQMLINEHVRLPHTREDIADIARAVDKVLSPPCL
ncbi:MAG TPA: DegT/DnrJ/EryC1/StrS family aminotransferase [Candidatus Acidoferrales bacterium]|nr:DegT/DnrJ/EryC1/StrS family aminotransferase [Candidatus Acidoferrales bacterium]